MKIKLQYLSSVQFWKYIYSVEFIFCITEYSTKTLPLFFRGRLELTPNNILNGCFTRYPTHASQLLGKWAYYSSLLSPRDRRSEAYKYINAFVLYFDFSRRMCSAEGPDCPSRHWYDNKPYNRTRLLVVVVQSCRRL